MFIVSCGGLIEDGTILRGAAPQGGMAPKMALPTDHGRPITGPAAREGGPRGGKACVHACAQQITFDTREDIPSSLHHHRSLSHT